MRTANGSLKNQAPARAMQSPSANRGASRSQSARAHPALSPPVPHDERGGQGDGGRLRQHRRRVTGQRQAVASPPRRLGESNPRERRAQVEQRGQQVLAPDDPGHRLDVQGMDGEQRGDRPAPRRPEHPHEPPDEHGVERVQRHVDGVIARRVQPPELVLEPERRVRQRPVVQLPKVAGREPDVPQPGPSPDERFLDDERLVVPHEAARQRRDEADDGERDEGEGGRDVVAREPRERLGSRRGLRLAGGASPGPGPLRRPPFTALPPRGPGRHVSRARDRRRYTYHVASMKLTTPPSPTPTTSASSRWRSKKPAKLVSAA